jgi:hypothetical protein
MFKIKDWIDKNKLDWNNLSGNPNAIFLLEKNLHKVNWFALSRNPNAIHILEKNLDKIDWLFGLSVNPNAIHLLEKNMNLISWAFLCQNKNAISLISQYKGKHQYNITPTKKKNEIKCSYHLYIL